MLDIAVIIMLLIAAFVGIAWYANRSRQQRTKLLEEINNIESEQDDSEQFSSVFQQQLDQQSSDNDHFEIDSEPKISLSEIAQAELAPQKINDQSNKPANDETVSVATSKPKINITIDDEIEQASNATADRADDAEIISADNDPAIQTNIIKDWDMVIAFTVMARDGRNFAGKSVKASLKSLDLHFGDLQIFHRSLPGLRKQTLFSVANILDPGTLSPDSFATMTTPGLLVFARLPGPVNGLSLFDDLLDVAQKMTDKLDGTLCDEAKQPLTQSAIEEMRSRILNLNLQLQTEQSSYKND